MSDNQQQQQQYGYLPIGPNDRVQIWHSSTYRSSNLRVEVFSQLGKAKQERSHLRRIILEETTICAILEQELENIGSLVFNDLEEECIAIGKIRNMLCAHIDILDNKLQAVEQQVDDLNEFRHVWLSREVAMSNERHWMCNQPH